jgi:hypothetical protein
LPEYRQESFGADLSNQRQIPIYDYRENDFTAKPRENDYTVKSRENIAPEGDRFEDIKTKLARYKKEREELDKIRA